MIVKLRHVYICYEISKNKENTSKLWQTHSNNKYNTNFKRTKITTLNIMPPHYLTTINNDEITLMHIWFKCLVHSLQEPLNPLLTCRFES